jgi:Flp pilus assembly protein TadD
MPFSSSDAGPSAPRTIGLPSGPSANYHEDVISMMRRLNAEGAYKTATATDSAALDTESDSLHRTADESMARGDLRGAVNISVALLQADPQDARALHRIAKVRLANEQWSEAIGVLSRLVALRGDVSEFLYVVWLFFFFCFFYPHLHVH